jgi:hypothetical protein
MTNADPIVIAAAARNRRDHFTTLDGPRLSARATTRTLSPASTRATARSRKSFE